MNKEKRLELKTLSFIYGYSFLNKRQSIKSSKLNLIFMPPEND